MPILTLQMVTIYFKMGQFWFICKVILVITVLYKFCLDYLVHCRHEGTKNNLAFSIASGQIKFKIIFPDYFSKP
jgi:hypothetical protein